MRTIAVVLMLAVVTACGPAHRRVQACPPPESISEVRTVDFTIHGTPGKAHFYKTNNGTLHVCFDVNGNFYELSGLTLISVDRTDDGGLVVVSETENHSKFKDTFDHDGNQKGHEQIP